MPCPSCSTGLAVQTKFSFSLVSTEACQCCTDSMVEDIRARQLLKCRGGECCGPGRPERERYKWDVAIEQN